MTGPDCAVMSNLISTHTHMHCDCVTYVIFRCNDVSIQNNVVYGNKEHGIMLHRSSDDGIIRNNTVSNNGNVCIALFESFGAGLCYFTSIKLVDPVEIYMKYMFCIEVYIALYFSYDVHFILSNYRTFYFQFNVYFGTVVFFLILFQL